MKTEFDSQGGGEFTDFLEFVVTNTTENYRKYVENLSQDQEEWMTYREARITSSIAHRVQSFNKDRYTEQSTPSVVTEILGESSFRGNAATQYGKIHEPVARAMYIANPGHAHADPKSVKVTTCGICLDSNNPLISASPDGLVKCKCCGPGLVEIKCLYHHQDENVLDVPRLDPKVPFVTHKGKIYVKQNSRWYHQIIAQLGVTQREYCDLVVYSKRGIAVTRCFPNPRMYKYLCQKGMILHEYFVFPEL